MSRMTLWLGIVIGSLVYLGFKCAVGWMCTPERTAEAMWWSGGALLLHWLVTDVQREGNGQ